jgi:hypothetical protein
MNKARSIATLAAALAFCAGAALAACGGPPDPASPRPLTVTTSDYVMRGEYRLVHEPADLKVNLPADADPARPVRHWALVTDAHVSGRRVVTFTHSESVKDFSIDLPDGDAPLQFAAFASRAGGGEVLVFATGGNDPDQPSFIGHVTINPK